MKRAALLALTALALIASGCGNSEENDYVKQVNTADAHARAAAAGVSKAQPNPKASAAAFETAADKLNAVVEEYEAIAPPDNAKKAHALTIKGLTGVVELFREFAKDTRAVKTQADADALTKQAEAISSAKPFRQLEQARRELADAGYKIEGISDK